MIDLNMSVKIKVEKLVEHLPGHVKAVIDRGRKQATLGFFTPHEEVMKKYAKYWIDKKP
jgi:predicted transcriptional regulator